MAENTAARTASTVIRIFGTALGAILGAFVPPAGAAVAAGANLISTAIDIGTANGSVSGGDAQASVNVKSSDVGGSPDKTLTDAPIPKLASALKDLAKPQKDTGKSKTAPQNKDGAGSTVSGNGGSRVIRSRLPEDEEDEIDISDDKETPTAESKQRAARSAPRPDQADETIRSLRETGDQSPDTQSLIDERNADDQESDQTINDSGEVID